ncbi:MAG: hypothetical protein K6D02_10005 [Lachnospiraceae bacterium]|nr:hypothetical protein [Lachnospiraceae bacterium]
MIYYIIVFLILGFSVICDIKSKEIYVFPTVFGVILCFILHIVFKENYGFNYISSSIFVIIIITFLLYRKDIGVGDTLSILLIVSAFSVDKSFVILLYSAVYTFIFAIIALIIKKAIGYRFVFTPCLFLGFITFIVRMMADANIS